MNRHSSPPYLITRALFAAALGYLAARSGTWWMGEPIGLAAMAFFLWAPHSGRYWVESNEGLAPLRLDERTQSIRDRAARNAFVAVTFALAGLLL